MKENDILKKYTAYFNYKKLEDFSNKKTIFLKHVDKGFIVIEKFFESKYVNFYFNDSRKMFKESDLLLAVMNNTPVAWSEEYVN